MPIISWLAAVAGIMLARANTPRRVTRAIGVVLLAAIFVLARVFIRLRSDLGRSLLTRARFLEGLDYPYQLILKYVRGEADLARRLANAKDVYAQELIRREVARGGLLDGEVGSPMEYSFVAEVAAEVVGRMGARPKTDAARAAARQLAFRIMREHNHRLSHIERDIPIVLALAETPLEHERGLDELRLTSEFTDRITVRQAGLLASVVTRQ